MGEPATSVYEFGDYQLDLSNKALLRKGTMVPLTPKVFDTLVLLVENSGRLVEKDEFLRRLWPDSFVEETAVAESVSRLRKALGDTEGQRFILTVPKRGYRFVADITKTAPAEPAPPLPSLSGRPPSWRRPSVALLGIAVLLAAGTTDELITQLAKIGAIRVISRASVMRFKGTRKSVAQIARELNVDAVVAGAIVRSGERVRVTAQIIRANPEAHLWAEQYDRPLGDIVSLQGELAGKIAQAIRMKVTTQEQARMAALRPVSPEAYEAYLKGRYYWSKRTERTTKKALDYFQQAIEKDPNYALAFTGMADCYVSLALAEALQEALSPNEAFPKARAAVNRALEIDGELAEAHASL